MNFSSQTSAAVKASLEKALKRYASKGNQTVITDIYLQPKPETGELVLMNDDDEVLAVVAVKEWEQEHDENFYTSAESNLRRVLTEVQEAGRLDKLCLIENKTLSKFFADCKNAHIKRRDLPFSIIWSRALKNASYLELKENEINSLSEVGIALGRYEADEQLRTILHTRKSFAAVSPVLACSTTVSAGSMPGQ